MRIAVTGASGNVGTGVLAALGTFVPDAELIGICRRPPGPAAPYHLASWEAIDLSAPDARRRLEPVFTGCDVVIHLAWAIQPVRDEQRMWRTNVNGSGAVLDAVAGAGVPHLVYSSTLAVYPPDADAPVTERWPATGQSTSAYSRQKVLVERRIDEFERLRPEVAVSRVRPTLVVQRPAAARLAELFFGPFVPRAVFGLLRRKMIPLVPVPVGLRLQFVHADDVGDAVGRIVRDRVRGTFNLAAEELDPGSLAGTLGARHLPVPRSVVRGTLFALFRTHVSPLSPGWFDVATTSPPMDCEAARVELGWTPQWSSARCLTEFVDALADGVTGQSPALRGP